MAQIPSFPDILKQLTFDEARTLYLYYDLLTSNGCKEQWRTNWDHLGPITVTTQEVRVIGECYSTIRHFQNSRKPSGSLYEGFSSTRISGRNYESRFEAKQLTCSAPHFEDYCFRESVRPEVDLL